MRDERVPTGVGEPSLLTGSSHWAVAALDRRIAVSSAESYSGGPTRRPLRLNISRTEGEFTVRYLVVIDHTLGGAALTSAVREHAFEEEGDIQVDVIVPAEQSETNAAQGRLEMELQRLEAEGIAAVGSVVEADPYKAISDAAERQRYDGIIIATHPSTVSRWMHLDLPRRVERELQIPVEWMDTHTDDPSEETEINIELPRAALDNEEEAPSF
jgi:hypothetical protein